MSHVGGAERFLGTAMNSLPERGLPPMMSNFAPAIVAPPDQIMDVNQIQHGEYRVKYGSTTSGGTRMWEYMQAGGGGEYFSEKKTVVNLETVHKRGSSRIVVRNDGESRERRSFSTNPTPLKVPSRNVAGGEVSPARRVFDRMRHSQNASSVAGPPGAGLVVGSARQLHYTPQPPPLRLPPPTSTAHRCTNLHLPGFLCTVY